MGVLILIICFYLYLSGKGLIPLSYPTLEFIILIICSYLQAAGVREQRGERFGEYDFEHLVGGTGGRVQHHGSASVYRSAQA